MESRIVTNLWTNVEVTWEYDTPIAREPINDLSDFIPSLFFPAADASCYLQLGWNVDHNKWNWQESATFTDHRPNRYVTLTKTNLRRTYARMTSICFQFWALLPCGHLPGKGWPLGSWLWYLIVFCHFPMWYPGSGVVLDCVDSWSLPPFLL